MSLNKKRSHDPAGAQLNLLLTISKELGSSSHKEFREQESLKFSASQSARFK